MQQSAQNVKKTRIMGVLNVTPDSFFDGGKYLDMSRALERAEQMLREGADIIDVGGESTRPPSTFHEKHGQLVEVSEEEERKRVLPVLSALLRQFPTQTLSVDTRRASIAAAAFAEGVRMVNYVTESVSPAMAKVIATHPEGSLVLCHMRGKPQSMQGGKFHNGPMIPNLREWFHKQIALLNLYGVKDSQIIIDPGIGFGKKKPDQDFEILLALSELKSLGYPLLIGLSRKSFMGLVLDKPANDLLSATLAMNALCMDKGVDVIRVHDVAEHHELRTLLGAMKKEVRW
ncbi:MAG: dihydropteroate synthase [Deltaproteobacteria bacterium]|nr:dihydropteroate synthase [Deltaproteobacteria bacterium]